MTTFISSKFKTSDDQTNIDKYNMKYKKNKHVQNERTDFL